MKIFIPTPLRQYAGGHESVAVEAATVGGALDQLVAAYPAMKKNLYNETDELRSFINIYKGDEDIRYLQNLATPLAENDELTIVPSIAGGAGTANMTGSVAEAAEVSLSNDEVRRYSRHLIMPEFGMEGQKKLKQASVLMIGAGGLGSPLGMYLAAAGIGKIGIVDYDVVDESNLQRQLLHRTADIGKPKSASAKATINSLNPNVEVETYNVPLTSDNALQILSGYDVIADGTDNFPTRYLVNDACVMLRKPNVYGSIFRFEGQVSVFYADSENKYGIKGACYRCLYPEPPPPGLVPSCAEGGVLGVLPGIIGTMQAIETIKLIAGIGEPLINRLLLFDALKMKFRELKLRKNPHCAVCSEHPSVTTLIDYEAFCGMPAHDHIADAALTSSQTQIQTQPSTPMSMQPTNQANGEITVQQLKSRMDAGEDLFIIDVREPNEYQIVKLGGTTLIPLNTVPDNLSKIPKDREVIVHCKMGGRSAKAIEFLKSQGYTNLKNLTGGINAYATEIDKTMPTY
ncbi:MAG: molybdopterin-synthase adenylyltransferase MoeB [Rhizobacter sp.]|nr:molybdopterin-synthase adenylyltransferase MoeB [Chlorobiales bacterium]